jgi:hypothetical protein
MPKLLVLENINSRTRAPKDGKVIICPYCNAQKTVGNFSWFALSCIPCDISIPKTTWLTYSLK